MPWRSRSPDPPAKSKPADDLSAELDLASLFVDEPTAAKKSDEPEWLSVEEPLPPSEFKTGYADVDHKKLRRQRAEREKAQTLWQRLKRGDLGSDDLPVSGPSNLIMSIARATFAPIEMVLENLGFLFAAAMLLLGLAIFATIVLSMLDIHFGYLV